MTEIAERRIMETLKEALKIRKVECRVETPRYGLLRITERFVTGHIRK